MYENHQDLSISFETALKIVDEAVFMQAARHLKNIEIAVLRGAWLGQSYDDIADGVGYTPEYIKHDVGPKLWKLLSSSFGEKVNKTNIMAVLIKKTSEKKEHDAIQPSLSNIEPPLGVIPLDSDFYVERPSVESRCYEEITRSGSLIRIKAPSKMGKTSLMIRILNYAKQKLRDEEVTIVALNLQRADQAAFADLDRFLRWFCTAVTRKLKLSHRVEDFWSETFGSKSNCTAYFEDCILSEVEGVLILALDQVDEVFLHSEIADDFFTLLRSWYEEATYGDGGNPCWVNLRLILVHSTEVYIPLDINKSPFNVGLSIELQPFSTQQVEDLARRYGVSASEDEFSQLMTLIGGHPYLVQVAFYQLATQRLSLDYLIETAATDASIYHHHLHRLLQNFQDNPSLAQAYHLVLKSMIPTELEQLLAFKLHSMGLVNLQGNCVVPSCELYRQYFGDRLS